MPGERGRAASTFLDEVTLELTAGAGGRGAVSFRREKYVPRGGPDGGDGGRGGSVVLTVDAGEATLGRFRERRQFRAGDGRPGGPALRSGAAGSDVVLHVPPGTVVTDAEAGVLLGDLTTPGERLIVVDGGEGGRGNARFASATRQAPRIGQLGEPGERRRIHLELKLIADVGLVGMPNAGKSTLLAALTGARPKIAAYPFTTLHPNLGVAALAGGRTLVLADVPGLIEGAHRGAGLGLDFLRHLERTRILVHVVDCSAGAPAARQARGQVEAELAAFSPALATRPTVVALNKVDLPEAAAVAAILVAELPGAVPISAATGAGTEALLEAAGRLLDQAPGPAGAAPARSAGTTPATGSGEPGPPAAPPPGGHHVYRYPGRGARPLRVDREPDGAYRVSGAGVERLVERTDLDQEEAVMVLQRRLAEAGVNGALAEAGCRSGATVRIGVSEFTYVPDEVPAASARPPRASPLREP
ncbi:MAG TPA: GTPase ObgE [Candidatus Binatia bacterium]|nr:GTPase ObgE [Candidatus Binatia bacterium]